MAAIILHGRVGVVPASVMVEVDHLRWMPLSTIDEVAQDALPNEVFSIAIHTEKGSFVWYLPRPDKPSWWRRLWGTP